MLKSSGHSLSIPLSIERTEREPDGGDARQFRLPPGVAHHYGVTAPETGSSAPLEGGVRDRMEQSFNADFSGVRIQEGAHVRAAGAEAYAQGNQVHFSPGHYRPGTPGGDWLIAHELAHVEQQRAGRVSKPQAHGASVNADPALEQEADATADRVMRGDVVGTGTRAASSTPAASGAPIQRKVGFEFETVHPVMLTEDDAKAINKDMKGETIPREVPSKEPLYVSGSGKWKIVSDCSKMEFVTDPLSSLSEVAGVMKEIDDFAQKLELLFGATLKGQPITGADVQKSCGGSVPRGGRDLFGMGGDRAYVFSAKPQASGGVKLEAIPSLMKELTSTKLTEYDDYLRKQDPSKLSNPKTQKALEKEQKVDHALSRHEIEFDNATIDTTETKNHFLSQNPAAPKNAFDKLAGMMTLVLSYVKTISKVDKERSNAKECIPLMARTDFHSMYQALTPLEQTEFLPFAGYCMKEAGFSLDLTLYEKGISVPEALDEPVFGPKLGDWLNSMAKPHPVGKYEESTEKKKSLELTKDDKKGQRDDLYANKDLMSRAPIATNTACDVSMGAMEMDNDLAVLEMRSLPSLHFPRDQWPGLAAKIFGIFEKVNH